MKTALFGRPLRGFVAALVLGLPGTAATTFADGSAPPAAASGVRVQSGRLDAGGGAVLESGALRPGVFYEVVGAKEARLDGPGGTSFRAMPGAKFLVQDADAAHVSVRLAAGVIADANGGTGMIDLATPAGTFRGDHATIYARVLPRGVYVEHEAVSTGTAGLFSPGVALVPLAPGTFRMMSLDAGDGTAGDRAALASAMAKAAPVVAAPPRTTDVRASSGPAPAALGPVGTHVGPGATEGALPYDPSCGPNPVRRALCASAVPARAPLRRLRRAHPPQRRPGAREGRRDRPLAARVGARELRLQPRPGLRVPLRQDPVRPLRRGARVRRLDVPRRELPRDGPARESRPRDAPARRQPPALGPEPREGPGADRGGRRTSSATSATTGSW